MARRRQNIISEYHFLKRKITRLFKKAKQTKGNLKKESIVDRITKFSQRMTEIEKECEQLGIPHPEANMNREKQINEFYKRQTMSRSRALYSPDGSLFKNTKFIPKVES